MNKKGFENKIEGFSKISKEEKIKWIEKNYFNNVSNPILKNYWNNDDSLQKIHDEFTENTLSNFYLPLGVAPNFLIDNKDYTIPMVIEESSVIAAACKAAKFWRNKGGFKTSILNFKKTGQVHFIFKGDKQKLNIFFKNNKLKFYEDCKEISSNMKKRGGGILNIELLDKTHDIDNYFQINAVFDTVDSMGANFINSCLEQFASTLKNEINQCSDFTNSDYSLEIIMSILSNYVPECLVRAEVSCDLSEIDQTGGLSGKEYANKFIQAINIAKTQTSRAVTHNKGIMNGIDAVLISTGNDFRAVDAGIHAFASSSGNYKSLSECLIIDNKFKISLKVPISVGTVGGITDLHPMVKLSLKLLGNPSSEDLMKIICSVGLAQNYAAVKSLVTTGIQKGHMKMHLINLLNKNKASKDQIKSAEQYFKNKEINSQSVSEFLNKN